MQPVCHRSEKVGVELLTVFGWSLEAAVDAFFTGGAGHLGASAGPAVDTAKVAEVFTKYKEADGDEIQVSADPCTCMCTYHVPAPWRRAASGGLGRRCVLRYRGSLGVGHGALLH